jgi:alpha-tubulin suppressor-like RCC1 family protein
MRRLLLFFFIGFAWVPASCSGDSTNVDAGPDVAAKDVAPDYYIPETTPPAPTIYGAQHTCMIIDYNAQWVTYCFGLDAALGATKQGILATTATGTVGDAGSSPGFLQLASSHGAGHTCAIDTQKQVWCWGDNTKGQCGVGNNTTTPITAPALVADFQFGIATGTLMGAGTQSTCIVREIDKKLECFGDNTSCEGDQYLADAGGCSPSAFSATLTTDTTVVFQTMTLLSQANVHGCVAASPVPSGTPSLFCWGDNASLESGPAGKAITTPAANVAQASVISVATGDAHTCYVTDSPHQLYCFGKNDVHQASPTATAATIDPTAAVPIALPQSKTALSVAARATETCVIDTDGLVWCFGNGHGTNIDQVMGVKDVAKVVLGQGHACAIGHTASNQITDPASVVCWGDNTNGQAGQTPGGTVSTPTAVVFPATAP